MTENESQTPLQRRAEERQIARQQMRELVRSQGIQKAPANQGSALDRTPQEDQSLAETLRKTEPMAIKVPDATKSTFAGADGPDYGARAVPIPNDFEKGPGNVQQLGSNDHAGGGSSTELGFTVSADPDNAGDYFVSASVVSGVSTVAKVPKIGSDPLTDDPAPTITVTTGHWVGLEFEVIPDSESDGDGGYRMAEGGTLTGDITVESYASEAAMETASQIPSINTTTGAVVDNGIFVVPLALCDDPVDQVGYYGPIGVKLCASGILQILGPVMVIDST